MQSLQWRPAGLSRQRLTANVACKTGCVVQRRAVLVRAGAADILEEIDETTGLVINKLAAAAPVAGQTIQAGSIKIAYRSSTLKDGSPAVNLPQLLLLHGLGSSSYSYRNTLGLLGAENVLAYAPDFPGHGDSEKPSPSSFAYDEASYCKALGDFVDAVGITKPLALCVQGYVTSQYALKWALENPGLIARLLILNTPLSKKSSLRPELAAYKTPLPFMRPAKGTKFDALNYSAVGSPYAIARKDAEVYDKPYKDDPAASVAIATTMDQLDWPKLLTSVDDEFITWRKPSLLLFGSNDPFVDVSTAFAFLDSKRTNMKVASVAAKLGHMPQEDYPEAIQDTIMAWLKGETDTWEVKSDTSLKLSKAKMLKFGKAAV